MGNGTIVLIVVCNTKYGFSLNNIWVTKWYHINLYSTQAKLLTVIYFFIICSNARYDNGLL